MSIPKARKKSSPHIVRGVRHLYQKLNRWVNDLRNNEITFSRMLKVLRAERNMTQQDLAAELGTTLGVVSDWETGRHMPNLETAKRLADVFGVTLDRLVGR